MQLRCWADYGLQHDGGRSGAADACFQVFPALAHRFIHPLSRQELEISCLVYIYHLISGAMRAVAAVGAGEERLMQVLRMMNVLLDRHPQSRRRGLSFKTLSIIPVWPQVES